MDGAPRQPIPARGHAARLTLARALLVPLALALLAGCQTGPGQIASCRPDGSACSRNLILPGQLAADPAAVVAQPPLETSANLIVEPAEHLCAASQGILLKRVLLPLSDRPEPIHPCRPKLDPAALEQ